MVPNVDTTGFVWVDWVLLGILVFTVLGGLNRGLVRQAIDFTSLFVGLYAADRFAPAVAGWLDGSFNLSGSIRTFLSPMIGEYGLEPIVLAVISFLLVWFAVSIIFNLLGSFLETVAKLPVLATANRLGGAALGAIKGGFVVFIVASLLSFLPSSTSLGSIAQRSYVVGQVRSLSPVFYQHLQDLMLRISQRQ